MSDRVMVVTGAQGILGQAVIRAGREKGLTLAALDIAPGPDMSNGLVLGGIDLTLPDQAQAAMQQVLDRFGRIDALLNIAGGFTWQTVQDADTAWEQQLRLNLFTAVNASRAALEALTASPDGRIVNVGAFGALRAAAGMGPYAAAKAAVHRFTEALAQEVKATPLTVNAVLPSILDTPQNRRDMPDADAGQWVAPHDLAEVMLFLASPQARAVTGALIPVTGRV